MKAHHGVALVLALTLIAGCSFGYSPEDPVSIRTQAPADLNFYGGQAHALDLYVYRVYEPISFEATENMKLLAQSDEVRGGDSIGRWTVNPGTVTNLEIGPMEDERYTHVGLFAAYREPRGNIKATVEIPASGKLKLVLDSNGLAKFIAD